MKYVVIGTSLLLLFILPMPNVIALRNLFFYILLISLIVYFIKSKQYRIVFEFFKCYKTIFLSLLVLTLWIFGYSVLFSHEFLWSLDEFRGQWITPLLYLVTSILLAIFIIDKKQYAVYTNLVFFTLFVHILYIDLYAIYNYFETGTLIRRFAGLMGSSTNANYVTNILLAFLVTEVIVRAKLKEKILIINNIGLFLLVCLVIFSSVIEAMRNGSVAIVFLAIMTIVFLFLNDNTYTKKIKILSSFVIVIVLLIPISYNLKTDSRWKSLIGTIPIALDIKNNKYWLNRKYDLPTLSDGTPMDSGSNYERIAWAYVGSQIILDNPFGIGFGRNVFGHALELKYGKDAQRGYHSHSAVIDFTLAVGFIGLFIWLFFIFSVIKLSIYSFKTKQSYYAILTFFLTTGFVTRSLVDSNMRDHMFLQFMLFLGLFMVFMYYEKGLFRNENQVHSC